MSVLDQAFDAMDATSAYTQVEGLATTLLAASTKAGSVLSGANAEALLAAYEATDAALDRMYDILVNAGLIGDDEEEMPGGMAEPMKSSDLITNTGSHIKAIGDGWVTGYLVRFGGDGDLSEFRDVFTKATDFGRATKTDVWVHHRMLPGIGKRRLTNQADIGVDDEGVFIKHLLNLRSSYERKLYGLVQEEKLGWSSGTAPHLVERKATGDGRHEIEQWPLGLDASYTPTPAGGMVVNASAMKTLMDDAGIDLLHAIYTDTEADPTEDAREVSDPHLKADTGRARRLSIEIDLLLLEATAR